MVERLRVSIIVLNWNTSPDTIECLDSLSELEYGTWDVVIVDNGSSDDSVDRIHSHLVSKGWVPGHCDPFEHEVRCLNLVGGPETSYSGTIARRCAIVSLPVNKGFTGGNNVAMRFAMERFSPDYMLLLNNDTIVRADFLKELIRTTESHPECGLASPMILDYRQELGEPKSNIIQYAGAEQSLFFFYPIHRRQSEIDDGKETEAMVTGYAHGTCLLARTSMVKAIGMLDEDYFCYREENDWAIRAKRGGYCSLFVPTAKVWHKGGRSSGRVEGMALYYMSRNGILIIKKNASLAERLAFAISFVGFSFPYRVLKLLVVQRDPNSAKIFVTGTRDGLKWKSQAH